MSAGSGGETSPVASARAVGPRAMALGADLPSAPSDTSHTNIAGWRLALVAAWAIVIVAFAAVVPADDMARRSWADGGWTLAFLATTVASAWAALILRGRDRIAWTCFALASGAWLTGQLIWDYYELALGIADPFPAISDLFYILFAPLYAIGLMFFGEKPKGTSIGPKLVSQLVMFGAAVYAAVGLHVSEAIVNSTDGPFYLVTAVSFPLFYDAAFLMGVLSLCLYVWGSKRAVLMLLVLSLGCHAVVENGGTASASLAAITVSSKATTWSGCWPPRSSSGRRWSRSAIARHITRRAAGRAFPDHRLSPCAAAGAVDPGPRHRRHLADPRLRRRRVVARRSADGADAGVPGVRARRRGGGRLELAHRRRPAARCRRRGLEGAALRKPPRHHAGDRPTAIIAIDQTHAIRLCSKGAAKLFGYAARKPSACRSRCCSRMMPPPATARR